MFGIAYARQMVRLLNDLDRDFYRLPRLRRGPIPVGSPKSFVRYHDPAARFELGYPAEWKLREDGDVHVSSHRMGSFARVDVVPKEADFWSNLERAVRLEAGEFGLDAVRKGPPERARGEIRMKGLRFSWDGTAYRLHDLNVILTLGNVVAAGRSRAVELYEDKVLEAIRRSFKLGPGLRRPG